MRVNSRIGLIDNCQNRETSQNSSPEENSLATELYSQPLKRQTNRPGPLAAAKAFGQKNPSACRVAPSATLAPPSGFNLTYGPDPAKKK